MTPKKLLCIALCMSLLLAGGCKSKETEPEMEPTEVVYADLGQTAEYGGMTFTVKTAEDPDITLSSGKKVMFFDVEIHNNTDQPVIASYLNNFYITVNGTDYDSDVCCTIPAMKELYDFYGESALNAEVAPGGSCAGYVACEVGKFDLLDLHFVPKTTDRSSRITVTITNAMVTPVSKNS